MKDLICPACKSDLSICLNHLDCASCRRKYDLTDSIARFTQTDDAFYEGKFVASITYSNGIKDRARHSILRRLRFLSKNLKKIKSEKTNLRILDLACGGGHEFFSKYGDVTGVDISIASLKEARKYYKNVVCAAADALPFADQTFDIVIAMDFFGHIENSQKNRVLKEIHRVLKKGGSTLQYIETLGENSMQKLAKRHEDLYKKYFIDPEGHVGLEPPNTVLERFYNIGLVPITTEGAYKTWLKQPTEISNRLGAEYSLLYPWLKIPVALDRIVSQNKILRFAGTITTELLSSKIDRLLPLKMADGLFLNARKG